MEETFNNYRAALKRAKQLAQEHAASVPVVKKGPAGALGSRFGWSDLAPNITGHHL